MRTQQSGALAWRLLVVGLLLLPAVALGGYFTVGGQTVLPGLTVAGDSAVTGKETVTGAVTLKATLDVQDAISNSGAANGGAVAINDVSGLRNIAAGSFRVESNAPAGTPGWIFQTLQFSGYPEDFIAFKGSNNTTMLRFTANGSVIGTNYSSTVGDTNYLTLIAAAAAVTETITGGPVDGPTAVGIVLNSAYAYATVGGKLLSVQNAGVEKLSIGYDGALTSASARTRGTITLSAGSGAATVVAGAICVCTDTSANASVRCAVASTTLTATGTGTDVIAYVCL